jgi:hypothetical protein
MLVERDPSVQSLISEKSDGHRPTRNWYHFMEGLPNTAQHPTWWVQRIVSGGQTGVDRAALDAAISMGIAHGGWCPKGRLAEDGPIAPHYQLRELDSAKYALRTKRNVLDSDATLVLYTDKLQGGSLLTYQFAFQNKKPCLKFRLTNPVRKKRFREWILEHQIRILNVAGPRASKDPQVYQAALKYLMSVFGAEKID